MTFDTFKKTDAARKCIYPVIHRLDALGNDAYGGRYYDGDQNVLHVNLTGIVTSTTSSISFHARYGLVKSAFNLTTVY